MNDERFEIVVVGGGPAGSSLAIRLAAARRKVLLVEKAKFPRHKLCGEFVSPDCPRHFRELGIEDAIGELRVPSISQTVFYSARGRSLNVPNSLLSESESYSVGFSRSAMDNLLLRRAAEVGVDVRTETSFRAPITENKRLTGVELRAKGADIYRVETPIAVDATGRGRILARSFEQSQQMKADLVAFKTHLRNARIEKGTCEIYSYQGGYGGCTEIEGGNYNLCFIANAAKIRQIGTDPKAAARELVMSNPRAERVLRDAEFIGEWHAVPIAKFGRESLAPFRGVFTVGDAAAFIDPFTGSGIALALESSKLAARAILSNKTPECAAEEYRSAYQAAFEPRLRFCNILRLASTSPLVAEATIAILARSSTLSGLFARATRSRALTSG